MEENKKVIAKFTIEVPKEAKSLANFVTRDRFELKLRPQFGYIWVQPDKGAMVATDTYIFQAYDVKCTGEWQEERCVERNIGTKKKPCEVRQYVNPHAVITPKTLKEIAGRTAVVTVQCEERQVEYRVFEKSTEVKKSGMKTFSMTTVECDGETYCSEWSAWVFPDWKRVVPDVNAPTGQHVPVTFDKKDFGRLRKHLLETDKKGFKDTVIKIKRNELVATVTPVVHENPLEQAEPITVALSRPSKYNVSMRYKTKNLYFCLEKCGGRIWFAEKSPAVLENDMATTIIMPLSSIDNKVD